MSRRICEFPWSRHERPFMHLVYLGKYTDFHPKTHWNLIQDLHVISLSVPHSSDTCCLSIYLYLLSWAVKRLSNLGWHLSCTRSLCFWQVITWDSTANFSQSPFEGSHLAAIFETPLRQFARVLCLNGETSHFPNLLAKLMIKSIIK